MKRKISLALAFTIILSFASCGGSGTAEESTTAAESETTTAVETEYSYPYPAEGFGGEELGYLNIDNLYTLHCIMTREEQTGDVLDDALYKRNTLIEEKFDLKLKEYTIKEDGNVGNAAKAAQQSILAGDNLYPIMFIPIKGATQMALDGSFVDLTTIDAIQLDQPWWYSNYNDFITINDTIYGAMGGAHLAVHDALRMMTFNSEMMETLSLDEPYDLVREGKWTLDRFNEYLSKAANLNGADSADWKKDAKTVYGYSNNKENANNFLFGCGELYVVSKDGKLTLDCGSERFYDVIAKVASIITTADAKGINAPNGTDSASDDGNVGYLYVFTSGRGLFAQSEVNKLQAFRSLDFEFGIVPYPKYDEVQENYYATTYQGAPAAYIPVTVSDVEKIGLVLDAMAYEGERIVVPAFREFTVEQKGLRNEDSIEMLELLTKAATPNVYSIFSIDSAVITQAGKDMWLGETGSASSLAANKSKIDETIKTVMENWK